MSRLCQPFPPLARLARAVPRHVAATRGKDEATVRWVAGTGPASGGSPILVGRPVSLPARC
jgi:hypothetical protein